MFSLLPPHPPLHIQNQYYNHTPAIPSPLSSSPLRQSPSPLSSRNPNVFSSSPSRDYDIESPTKRRQLKGQSYTRYDCGSMTETWENGERRKENMNVNTNARTNPMITPPHTDRTRRESVYSKRTTKSNPLLHNNRGSSSSDEGRETRRKLFLKRVRDGAEEKRFKARGLGDPQREREEEEMLRCVWLQEERKREERVRREARALDEMGEKMIDDEDERMAEEFATSEERELEEMLERLSQDQPSGEEINAIFGMNRNQAPNLHLRQMESYGSDGDEYDDIFMDVIEEENRISSQRQEQSIPAYVDDQEMMDMS